LLRLLQTIARATVAELCLGGALLGAASVGGWLNGWLDVVAALAPAWLAISLLGGALAWPVLEPGARRPALVAAAIGVALSAAVVVPELLGALPSPPARHPGPPLKVLTFNVWDDNRHSADTADAILSSGADVVALQEFFGLTGDKLRALHAAYPYVAGCPAGCDLIMMSKRPWLVGGEHTALAEPHDLAIWGETTAPDGAPVWVLTTHYLWPLPPQGQARQRAVLAQVVRGLDKADLVVAGDFNLAPWTAALRRQDAAFAPLTRRTHAVFTWPATIARLDRPAPAPILPIDQLYAGPDWSTVSVRRLPRAGSDHYGIVVTLVRPTRAPAHP
jgi:endonuclease/exonuclease/phosphatase (EEP) superfamily protein YafD